MGRKSKSAATPVSTSNKPEEKLKKPEKQYEARKTDLPKLLLIPITILLGVSMSWGYNHYLAIQINTPLNEPKALEEQSYTEPKNLDRYWGTYRPNLYFGLKTRSVDPLSVGMMWFNQLNPKFHLRHWCSQNDGLAKYGWIAHDGRNFGIHDIYESNDNRFSIRNSWIKRLGGSYGGDWTVKTQVNPFDASETPKFVSVFFYFAKNNTGWIKSIQQNNNGKSKIIEGETNDLGKFKIKLEASQNQNILINSANGNAQIVSLADSLLKNQYFNRIEAKLDKLNQYVGLRGIDESELDSSNFIIFQISGFAPFEFELLFESESLKNEVSEKYGKPPKELKNDEFDATLTRLHGNFQNKFEKIFQLREKQLSGQEIMMSQAALSNLLGGIGFFTGQSIVQSLYSKEPVLYWESNLYTAVPSRSFFPRGFLWDEGFHNILIQYWDQDITKDIISHWLDLINAEGWIPREVILGDEARARVPQEFWIQKNEYANPPTLFITLQIFIEKFKNLNNNNNNEANIADQNIEFIKKIYPRLKHWYNWFNRTQIGKQSFTYRWRGRLSDISNELNPKTLTSGLDDYPRASHPTDQERHIDLRCWIALASKIMAELAQLSGNINDRNLFNEHYLTLSDNNLLDSLHWSGSQYADYGLHSDNIKLVRQPPRLDQPNNQQNQLPMIRKVESEPTYQFINDIGYVSLFPMLLQILKPDSPKLEIIFDQIKNPQLLWTKYGLRSLAKNAPLYNKFNTEHDPPYWRGAIWINMNFLALKSLKYYSSVDGPYKQRAAEIHKELRDAIIKNILENYSKTGYIWEQYNDVTGKGQGSHPFTGWSALVTLIMAEKY